MNYEAVDKYGISLSASTLENSEFVKSLGKSWNQLSDNEKMMASYNEMVRQGASAQGLAKQEAESFGMKFKLLKQQISETVGEIGSNLLPVLEPLIQKFSEVATKISEWVKENPQLTQTILVVVGAIGMLLAVVGPIIALIGTLTLSVTAFNIASLPVTGTILAIISVITLLVAGIGLLIANWDWVIEKVKEVGEAFKNFAKTGAENFNKLKKDVSNVVSNVIQWFTDMKNKVGEAFRNLCQTGKDNFNRLKSDLTSAITSTKDSVVNKANEIKTNVCNAFVNLYQTGKDNFNKLKSDLSSIASNISSTVSNAFNNMKSSISNIMGNIKGAVSSAWNGIKSIFSSVLKPNIKIPKISISGKFSLNPPSVPKFGISWYSKGAIFKRPTVLGGMGVGDAHNGIGSNAEAILPINQLPKLLGLDKQQQGGISVNIENFTNNTDRDINELVEEIAFLMKRKRMAIGG